MKSCPNCQAQIPDENKFCSKCGYKIPEPTKPKFIYCPGYNDGEILFACLKCGSQFSSEDGKFCPQCGNQVPNSMNDPSLMPWSDIHGEVTFNIIARESDNKNIIEVPFIYFVNSKPYIITGLSVKSELMHQLEYLKTIKLPITIKTLGDTNYNAYKGYDYNAYNTLKRSIELLKIEIPRNNNLECIGNAFFSIDPLIKSNKSNNILDSSNLFTSNKLAYINDYAFFRRKLSGNIILPKSLKYIGEQAFCASNATIVVPESTSTIGPYAFEDCIIYYKGSLKDYKYKRNWGAKEFYNYYPDWYKG